MKSRIALNWTIIRKSVQVLSLVFFIAAVALVRKGQGLEWLIKMPVHVDPLLVISSTVASRKLAGDIIFTFLMLILTLVFGRFWCGWLCPLGTTLDIFRLRKKDGLRIPERLRNGKYISLAVSLVGAFFGLQIFPWLDPVTIFNRLLITILLPALDLAVTSLQTWLSPVSFLSGFVDWIDSTLRPGILPFEPFKFRDTAWILLLPAAIILLNAVAHRFWCRYICPLGGLYGLLSRFAVVNRMVNPEKCISCHACSQRCPTATIDDQHGFHSDPAECTVCMNCISRCPTSANSFKAGLPHFSKFGYDPARRQLLSGLGLTALAALFFRVAKVFRYKHIRPPGVDKEDFLSQCIRCGACYKVCPTNAIQPVSIGDEGLGSPELIPRIGYCDYSCNACGLVCPTQAIPALPLEEKRLVEIGKAVIYTDQCIAWAEHRDCIVCEEMCPIPQKAIYLKERTFQTRDDENIRVKLPFVDRDLCIGCGICENKCPVQGQAAIRVSPTGANDAL